MGSNTLEEGENSHHTIQIWEVNKERLVCMQEKIKSTPKLLTQSAGLSSCSIFRVPQRLIDVNGRVYQPHMVSIGPYHHGDPQLQMIEEHKWRFLGALLNRTQSNLGLSLEDYLKAIQPLEANARECYSENLCFEVDEFIEMLVLDGCFIIELFRRFCRVVPSDPGDPLVCMSWVLSLLLRDLIRIENQIPFFVLQRLYDVTKVPGVEGDTTLSKLALDFFNCCFQRPDEVIGRYKSHEGKHLLHFLRSTFIPQEEPKSRKCVSLSVLPCISRLRRSGITLTAGRSDSFLAVKFQRGEILMPTITFDDFMSCFMANCIAFEQCHRYCSKHFSTYATFWDCLITTTDEVKYISDRNIIDNYFGTDDEVLNYMHNLGKDLVFDIDLCYLSTFFMEVDEHYRSPWKHYKSSWHDEWDNFRYTYFSSPWSFISLVAAAVLLVATVLQTYYTVLAYVKSTRP